MKRGAGGAPAIGMEARRAETRLPGLGAKHDSPGPKGIARLPGNGRRVRRRAEDRPRGSNGGSSASGGRGRLRRGDDERAGQDYDRARFDPDVPPGRRHALPDTRTPKGAGPVERSPARCRRLIDVRRASPRVGIGTRLGGLSGELTTRTGTTWRPPIWAIVTPSPRRPGGIPCRTRSRRTRTAHTTCRIPPPRRRSRRLASVRWPARRSV